MFSLVGGSSSKSSDVSIQSMEARETRKQSDKGSVEWGSLWTIFRAWREINTEETRRKTSVVSRLEMI